MPAAPPAAAFDVSDLHGAHYSCPVCSKDLSRSKVRSMRGAIECPFYNMMQFPGRVTHLKDCQKKHKVNLEGMESLVVQHKKRPPAQPAKKELRSKFFAGSTSSEKDGT